MAISKRITFCNRQPNLEARTKMVTTWSVVCNPPPFIHETRPQKCSPTWFNRLVSH